MAGKRPSHHQRRSRLGWALAGVGALFALGAASYGYAGHLLDISAFRTDSRTFVVTTYPVRIAFRTPLHVPPADEAPPELNSRLPMASPVQSDEKKVLEPPAESSRSSVAIGERGTVKLLKINYSIAGDSPDEAIVVSKKLIIDDVEKGLAELKISHGSRILIRSSDLAGLEGQLGPAVVGALRKSEYVNFDDLRSLGLVIRYDAVRDRVLVSSASA